MDLNVITFMFNYISPGLKTNKLFADTCTTSGLQNLAQNTLTVNSYNSYKQCIIEFKTKMDRFKIVPFTIII